MKYATIVAFAKEHGFRLSNNAIASRLGKRASKLCKEFGLERKSIPDERWGKVWSYPSAVLDEIFANEFGSTGL
jgi:hypothetical protein